MFIKTTGNWQGTEKCLPGNDENQYYAVTLRMVNSNYCKVADEYWRYWNNQWESYYDGKWNTFTSKIWEVAAYIKIAALEPYAAPLSRNSHDLKGTEW